MKTDFAYVDKDGDELGIEPAFDPSFGAFVKTTEDGVYVAKEDAPAAALAILKAAGWRGAPVSTNDVEKAAYLLEVAAQDEELAQEALALLNAATDSCYVAFPNETIRETWLRAARRARELHS